tara:strand:- start:190 stop:357 length:168 start_codon:yes stop_codon:yes gene_type:complete
MASKRKPEYFTYDVFGGANCPCYLHDLKRVSNLMVLYVLGKSIHMYSDQALVAVF